MHYSIYLLVECMRYEIVRMCTDSDLVNEEIHLKYSHFIVMNKSGPHSYDVLLPCINNTAMTVAAIVDEVLKRTSQYMLIYVSMIC